MLAVALGLVSGLAWGVADFLGGLASRRAPTLAVVASAQAVGLGLALLALGIGRPPLPAWDDVGLGLASGASGALGVAAFYRGLAVGQMSMVAPISALGALVPVTVGLAGGDAPGALGLTGMAVAIAGGSLAARAPGPASRQGLGLALVAALGFGGFFSLLAAAADGGALWALVSSRSASVPLALAAALAVGSRLAAIDRRALALILPAGSLEMAANLAYAQGTREGLTAIVAVLGSLYPVATVALAGAVLGERLGRLQAAGAAVALAGVVMIAAG